MKKQLFTTSAIAIMLAGVSMMPQTAQAFDLRANNTASNNVVAVNQSIEQSAQDFISKMAKQGIDFLANPDLTLEQRKSEFRSLLSNNFDMKTIGRFSLGTYWRSASEPQKEEYLNLFEKNVIDVYSKRFSDYQGEEFKVTGASATGKSDAMVHSYIDSKGQKIAVDWRVREKNGQMRVIDISVEGVSMATTQRSEFASIIQRGGGDIQVLINHLKS